MDRFPGEWEALIKADVLDALFAEMDRAINRAGFIPRSGQIADASLVAAPRQRNTDGEKAAIRAGKTASEIWPQKPAKAAQKDVDGRWMVKYSKAKVRADGSKPVDIAIPVHGYKSHVSIDRMHGVIRRQIVTPFRDIASQYPDGQWMPQRTSRANGRKSMVRSKVEHVFAQQKSRIGLTIRTIGLARVKAAITLVNIAYNMTRLRWLQSRTLPA